mmetsp:Transcript_12092/g.37840  ORF Transcript_12092/g.37840 Transcript_12092/m.37840 type:complete len:207 (-) Transcript_12092:415-1035(-)
MSWPFAPSAAMPRSSNGRSTGIEMMRAMMPATLSTATFGTVSVLATASRGSLATGPPFSTTLRFFAAGGSGSTPCGAGAASDVAKPSSSSSSATTASSRIRPAEASSPERIAARTASRTGASKILSSCQACNILATSRFSCSDCALRKVFTAMACTLSVSSALYRPVLSIKRMSSMRCKAWMSSHGKHCFIAKSLRTCDSCLACFA